jgi:regulator of protease activity HflC (stomatin/prohibitin superfamily)
MAIPAILTRTLDITAAPSRGRNFGVGIIAAAFLVVAFLSYFTVAQYERGVVSRFGRLSYVAEPGLHFKMPFIDSVRIYRVDIQQFTTSKLQQTAG